MGGRHACAACAATSAGLEVVDQVVGRLDPDREADEVARRGERRVGGRRVRHPRGVLDQALDAAEALGERPDLRARDERDGLLLGLDEERDHAAEVAHLPGGDLVARVAPRGRGRGRARPRGCASRNSTTARAFSQCAASARRASSARAGRASSRTAPGPRRATSAGSGGARRSSGRSSPAKPPTTSEWPPRYFVVEWTTMSAPSASGCWRYGVAKVLSTTTSAPAACAASAAARMSTMFSSGFVGVSIQTSRVRSSRCAARCDISSGGTNANS